MWYKKKILYTHSEAYVYTELYKKRLKRMRHICCFETNMARLMVLSPQTFIFCQAFDGWSVLQHTSMYFDTVSGVKLAYLIDSDTCIYFEYNAYYGQCLETNYRLKIKVIIFVIVIFILFVRTGVSWSLNLFHAANS